MELTSGERIKLRRKELKISQTELAQKVGYSKSALCKIEKNQGTVNMAKIADFAKVLNTTVAYLVGYDEQADPTLQIIENFVALSQEDKIRVVRCVLQKTDNYDELITTIGFEWSRGWKHFLKRTSTKQLQGNQKSSLT